MSTDYRPEGMEPMEPEHETEGSDINVRGVLGFGAGLAVCTILVCLVLFGMFKLLVSAYTSPPVTQTAMVGTREPQDPSAALAKTTFPEPRLQTDYFSDLAKVRQQWNQRLNSYGWLDQNAGKVHIPIERAMELTLQRGLPARSAGELPGASGVAAQTPPAKKTQTPPPALHRKTK